jgi:hypothetical protein
VSKKKRTKSSEQRRPSNKTPRTPRTVSSPPAFVNYTPQDRKKILTGVAPSGSSKTKARRDREALEKRRKLSEAAKRAVLEAGGDLASLEREGLLALEGGVWF